MRYAELMSLPSTPEEAKDSIFDLMSVYLGKNKSKIPMDDIVDMLGGQGYNVTPGMIMDVLRDNEMVKRITKDSVELKGSDEDMGMIPDKEKEKTKKHVKKMAKKTIKKDTGIGKL